MYKATKTNMSTAFKTTTITILAYLLGSSVVLSSVHAKDLASHGSDLGKAPASALKIHADDISAKAIGELHIHVDKTVFKAFAKSSADQVALASGREQRQTRSRYQRSVATILMECSLITKIVFARAFSL